MKGITLTLLALLAATPTMHAAGDGPLDRATLRGLKAISVVVDPLGADLEREGLSRRELQTLLEGRLKRAGVPVDPEAADFVGLRIMSAQGRRTPVALSLSFSLYQSVALARDSDVKTVTDTWGVQSVLLAQPRQVNESILETVGILAQQFVEAYRSVNSN